MTTPTPEVKYTAEMDMAMRRGVAQLQAELASCLDIQEHLERVRQLADPDGIAASCMDAEEEGATVPVTSPTASKAG
ncbi:hypothetical protein [Streptomyces sp. NPDC048002]|uniref:hypothetical protein n=1 Tax=Streptomyces sp. NPDC048002 TaxID=3154344 RepID=UPI0033F1B962